MDHKLFQADSLLVLSKSVTTIFCMAILLLSGLCSFANDIDAQDEDPTFKQNSFTWMHETTGMAKQTFSDKKNLELLGVTALGSAALILSNGDDEIRSTFDDINLPSGVGTAGNVLGGAGPFLLDLGLYTHGKINDNERSVEVSKVLSSALAIDLAVGGAMKLSIGRHRPDDGSSGEFDPFTFDNRSFPSGHTSLSFTTATVLAEMYDDKRWVGVSAYSTATFVGIARISDDSHWASDVLFGAVKGYVIGKSVSNLHKNGKLEGVNIIADLGEDNSRIGLGFTF